MANSVTQALNGAFCHHVNNVLGQLTAPQMAAAYPLLTAKTATKSFSLPYNGHVVFFEKGRPVMCDAGLLASLAAASAPVV